MTQQAGCLHTDFNLSIFANMFFYFYFVHHKPGFEPLGAVPCGYAVYGVRCDADKSYWAGRSGKTEFHSLRHVLLPVGRVEGDRQGDSPDILSAVDRESHSDTVGCEGPKGRGVCVAQEDGVGGNGFSSCISLNELTLPAGVTSIPASLVLQDYALTRLTIPGGVTMFGRQHGEYAGVHHF